MTVPFVAGEGWGFEVTGGNAVGIFISKVSSNRKELQVRESIKCMIHALQVMRIYYVHVHVLYLLIIFYILYYRLVTRFLSSEVRVQSA